MPFGLTSSGFSAKNLTQILDSIRARQKVAFGDAFAADVDTSVVGQLNGVYAAELAELWNAAQVVWASLHPDTASGVSLDRTAAITGAVRLPATKSTVTLRLTGTNGTVVSAGFTARAPNTDIKFTTTAGGTVSGGILDLPAECTVFGPTLAPAGTLTEIFTPTSGITAVTNQVDAEPGRLLESDADFRIRREGLLRAVGGSTIDAIRADVLAVDGVDEVYVFNNPTNSTNGDGLPPHSFEVVVRGGANQDIFDAIGSSQPAGIESYGAVSGTFEDNSGNLQDVALTRPTETDIYIDVVVTTDDTYPVDGDAQIKQALVDFWEATPQRVGVDVVYNRLFGAIYSVTGVTQVTTLEIGTSPSPSGTSNITIAAREIAVFDTANITVTS